MSKKYPNLLSPIKVGNVVFKNRMTSPPSGPHFVQGGYPTEAMITYYANRARNGAALVICSLLEAPVRIETQKLYIFGGGGYARHRVVTEGEGKGSLAESIETYLPQLTEAVHFYGAKASIGVMVNVPTKYDVSAGIPGRGMPSQRTASMVSEELPEELMDGIADEYAEKAAFVKDLGFDGLFLHMSYRISLLARFLSPLTNRRTDQYGGSLANRARFPLMVADRIKQKCGPDFFIEACISGDEPFPDGETLEDLPTLLSFWSASTGDEPFPVGLTLEDTIEYAKMFADHIDMLMLRSGDHDHAHPIYYNPKPTPFLYMAEAVKKSGAYIAVVTSGGYQNLDVCENVIASGKADFIAMARAWISNPDFGRKAYEGRGEDVVPCLRCNRCVSSGYMDSGAMVCSVNPIHGFEHKIEGMIEPPTEKKKVAVVGGGPAGMEAALIAAGRGHRVTLYEKSDTLGGLLNMSNNVSFKRLLKNFRNYLLYQIKKANVDVRLNTEATPEMLKKEEFDAVFAAVGGEPIVPDIPGVNGENVVFAKDVYGHEDALAENIVIIGGGETGVETGMHLAEKGHKVTVLEMGDVLAPRSPTIHFYSMFKEAWERLENFKFILNARCNSISVGKVTYVDTDGKEQSISAESVVIAMGYQPKNELALGFAGAGDRFFMIGDCNKVGNVQKVMRSAYSTASMF